ncbi:GH25 family lysozyme [Arthrobacter sp. ok362]|uniref:GH25 family lysozyme n=1 Tax=Arthrobacter sp. ok362 TaxID=1761745 RepID=UPI000B84D4BF|nr:GH25 family lysozyme [Arthrobacter sp. ok362]
MKPNTTPSTRRTSRLKTVAVVVVTAVATLGLPAQAWALEPAPSASPTATATASASQNPASSSVARAEATPAPSPVPTAKAVPTATATQAVTGTAPGAIDMKALNAAIGANGAYMGQGLKTRLAGSPRSGASSAVAESLQIESTWKAPGVQGLDVSGYQPTVNWPAQYSMGARFAYVKASEGLSYRSPTFASQYSGSLNAGLMRGAYHFALPSVSTGAAQADYFINSGGGWSPDGKTMPPLLDIEYNPYATLGNTCYNMSAAAMVGWLKDFSNRMLSRTGRLPMIYTTAGWWSQCTGNSGAFGNQPLHLASYSTYVGNVPNGWGTYSVWQYSSTGPFAGDSNAWNGSYANLQKFASTADGAVPKPSIMSTGDLVAADASGALWDYPATGTGGFGTRKQIGQGWKGLRSINVIDWNADGVLDAVAQWTSGRVNVYLGIAAGGFSAGPVLAASGWGGYQLTIGYWLSSSYFPQVLTRDDAGNLTFWRNSSGGGLGTASKIGTGWTKLNLTMVDFDGDGTQDILAQDSAGTMRQYPSNGAGAFNAGSPRTVGTGWNQMTSLTVTFSFKGYAKTGLMARSRDGNLRYYPVPGNSTWGASTIIGSGWGSFLIAGGENINNAATPTSPTVAAGPPIKSGSDVVRVDAAGKLWVHPANGVGGLNAPNQIGTGWSAAKTLHVLDWNKDGVPDVLAQWSSGALSVYFGAKTGGFTGPVTLASTGFAKTTFVTGRWVKASSYPGLVGYGSDGALYYWANVSGRALSAPVKIGAGWGGLKIAMTDFDSDGNQDLLAVNSLGAMRLYRSNGQKGFVSETRKVIGSGWQSFRQFSSTAGFTGTTSKGVMALLANGQLGYYPIVAGSKWGPRTTAGTLPSSTVVSMATSAY